MRRFSLSIAMLLGMLSGSPAEASTGTGTGRVQTMYWFPAHAGS
jgi:hypothetical protein